ncbi:cryptochrome/photolyase family protein [Limnohabitans sp. JirII-29]|uniref:cryptochrome/photolyase family protein n=1 Tax=Limnohabitans sp. JirII-29 TaxID=1835756 RepID=UPI000D3A9E5F|nr:cryptochrome/photolyase family protein [Limnohabitans sp. JirII-29]PUE29428.1 cryptochrome/photolyase family protein [Limnohabitans sp. JirII-29]
MSHTALRHLVIVLGDQLNLDATALHDFDPSCDAVWMAEVIQESTHIPSSKQRTTVFLSAMRHFAQTLRAQGWPLHYTALDTPDAPSTLAEGLSRAIEQLRPQALVLTAPGDWRVLQALRGVAREHELPLQLRDDLHFFSTVREFAEHAKGRKQLRLEYWYRALRQKTGILMADGKPVGGQWNFDADNRASFGKQGPPPIPAPKRFAPDAITQEVMTLVNTQLAHHPGHLSSFGWPVTRDDALLALQGFITQRLPLFGQYQDAMWEGEVWLYHSHLSCALNLKLLNPREVVQTAVDAYTQGLAPLPAVEGFVRQILGWREYVRGIYWTHMPEYLERNTLNAQAELPAFYWTGDTDMACLRDAIGQTLQHGYAHHIQRLMVTGLYALLLGVKPQAVHAWYLGVYVDAVEWVELPNTLGMSQFADDGLMASKPYAASGKYIQRMSNHCQGCRYDPAQSTSERACPITTLYWDFLMRHADTLAQNPRMVMQVNNLKRLSPEQREAIAAQALVHREQHEDAELAEIVKARSGGETVKVKPEDL